MLFRSAREKYKEDLDFLKDMDGFAYSNVEANAEKLGFELLTMEETIEKISENDVVIPF